MFDHLAVRRILGGVTALCGALFAQYLGIPLPWLLGPMLSVAALRLSSAPVAAVKPLRAVGQWVIGVSLGLFFSVEILDLVTEHWMAILIGTTVPILISVFGTFVLSYVGRADLKTAWFSSAIGGASEMSSLAERYGARVDLVASAHCLRILAVVIVIPFGYLAWGLSGTDSSLLTARSLNWNQFPLLVSLTVLSGYIFKRLNVPTAWVLGPLFVAATLSILGYATTTLPTYLVNAGQLLIGWGLGDNYRPAFFKAAPRFLLGVAIFSAGAMGIAAGAGYVVSIITGLPLPTIWLGLAPGGLAEMAITAKVLNLGVPVVTAFQVCRLVFVVLVTGWFYKKYVSRLDNTGS